MVWERIEIDAIRDVFSIAQTIRIDPSQDLLEQFLRLIQEITWCDRFGDLFAMRRVVCILGGVDNRLEERLEGVRIFVGEILARREGTAGVTGPDLLAQHENEAFALVHRALVEWIRSEIAIDVSGP